MSLKKIKGECESDEEFKKLMEALVEGKWAKNMEKWKPYSGEFSCHEGFILREKRIFIPHSLRSRVLTAAHEGQERETRLTFEEKSMVAIVDIGRRGKIKILF